MIRSVSAQPLLPTALAVHASLLESVRRDHERVHGRVESSGELLQLVAFNASFAWLAPLTSAIDALQEQHEGAELALLALLEEPSPFRTQLIERLQHDPEVAWPYAQLQSQLRAQAPKTTRAPQSTDRARLLN